MKLGLKSRLALCLVAALVVLSLSGPAAAQTASDYTTYYRYDAMRRLTMKIGPDPDGAGGRPRTVEAYHYNADGLVDQVRIGATTLIDGSDFSPVQTTTYLYDAVGNKVRQTTPAGVTEFSYDADDRPTCTAIRMDPNVYASLPTTPDACAAWGENKGPYGPDQITKNVYDAAGQVTEVQRGLGTSLAQVWSKTTYTANGKVLTTADANKNVSTYRYDGFDRLERIEFPSTDVGLNPRVSNPLDYERYAYDENGNRKLLRKRDGLEFTYDHDALNRLVVKHYPGDALKDVHTTYDLLGRVLSARYANTSDAGVVSTYDRAGRRETETTNGVTVGSLYDAASNRTRVTWSDGFYVAYDYDNAGLLKQITEPSGHGLANDRLAGFTYDSLGRRSQRDNANGTIALTDHDAAGRLAFLHQGGFASGATIWQDYAYSPAGQITELTQNNPEVVWTDQPTELTSNTYNGLNQDAAIAAIAASNNAACGAGAGYDCNGNLLTDGTRKFVYDAENRLVQAKLGDVVKLTISYDPLGRILQTVGSGATTRFVYDGDRLIGEYSGTTPLRRYVHGVGVDEPLVWYEGSTWSDRRWLHADRQGSVLAYSYLGGATSYYRYGPYGEVQNWGGAGGGSRFRYTGQIALPEAELFHYKARVYDPKTGRFLQTDPIGYKDDLNWYAYVGNDPLNRTDPTGLECVNSSSGTTNCASDGKYDVTFKTPAGFQSTNPNASDYHQYSVPNNSPLDASSTRDWVKNNPTPGTPSPATPQGTLNNATPSPLGGVVASPVTSFAVKNGVTGNNVVVNVTMPGHPLGNGVVVRDVTPNANGSSTIQNYGEGNGRLQAPGSPIAGAINGVWASPSMRPPSPQTAPKYDLCTSHPGAC